MILPSEIVSGIYFEADFARGNLGSSLPLIGGNGGRLCNIVHFVFTTTSTRHKNGSEPVAKL